MSSRAVRLAPLVLLAALALPRPAQACGEEEGCDYTNKWLSVAALSELVSADGAVVLRGSRGHLAPVLDDAEALAALSALVTLDGEPVAGSLELAPEWDGILWRPDAPPPPGLLSITLSIDNTSVSDSQVPPSALPCSVDDTYEVGPFEVEISAEPLPGLELVAASVELGELFLAHETTLETLDQLVCCDGALPLVEDVCGLELFWGEGSCARTLGTSRASVSWGINLDQLPPALAGNLAWKLGAEPITLGLAVRETSIVAPTCQNIEVSNLATGETLALGEFCVGEEVVDNLGPRAIDPSEELAACVGEPYVCEVEGSAWDPEACTPFDDDSQDGETGGGEGGESGGEGGESGANEDAPGSCSVDPRGSGGRTGLLPLGLIALIGFSRRRRRPPS